MPLFNKANKARIQANALNSKQYNLLSEQYTLQTQSLRQQKNAELNKQLEGVNYYENEGLQYATEIIQTAQKSYANGDMTYWNYISFLNQAIDIKKQYAEAIHAYNQTAIETQFPTIK